MELFFEFVSLLPGKTGSLDKSYPKVILYALQGLLTLNPGSELAAIAG